MKKKIQIKRKVSNMKKVSKLLVVLFMLVLSMNFVMADIVGPGDERPRPTRPVAPTSENVISPTAIIVIGVVLAVVAAVVVVMGLNKIKNDEMMNNTQVAFGSVPKAEANPAQEAEMVEEKENEEDEEIK